MVLPAEPVGRSGQIAQHPGRDLPVERFAGHRPLLDPQPTDFDEPGSAGSGKCVLKGVGGGEDRRALAVAGIRDDFGLNGSHERIEAPTGEDALPFEQRLFGVEGVPRRT